LFSFISPQFPIIFQYSPWTFYFIFYFNAVGLSCFSFHMDIFLWVIIVGCTLPGVLLGLGGGQGLTGSFYRGFLFFFFCSFILV